MRKLLGVAAILALVACGLLIVAALSLNRIIARNRATILQRAEAAIGRHLTVDAMTVSLWGGLGVRLERVRIADDPAFSDTDFLRAAAVTARTDLWPLLRGELRVGRVDVREPEIQLLRDASGRWNYSTLKPLRSDTAAAAEARPAIVRVAATETVPSQPPPLLISRATVQNGTVVVTDRSRTPPQTTRIEQVNLAVNDISITRPIRFTLDAAVQADAANVHVRGHLGPLQDRAAVPIELAGTLGPLGARGVRFDDLQVTATITPDAVRAPQIKARAFGGSIALNGQYPLQREGAVLLKGQLTGVAIAKVLEVTMADAVQRIAGRGEITLDLHATGNAADTIQSTLAGTVTANVTDGVIKDFNVVNEVLGRLTGLPGVGNLISANVKPKYGRLFSEPETRFETLRGTVRIANERMQTDDLTLVATDYGMRANGWIAFNRDADLSGTLAMSPAFSRDVAAEVKEAKYLMDARGQLAIPFRLRGKIGHSKPQPDMTYLADAVARGLAGGGAKDLIEKLLGGKSKRATPSAEQPRDPLEQRLRDLLGR